jgi:NhaP-type Na+/H+ and K+/H+ antiporter
MSWLGRSGAVAVLLAVVFLAAGCGGTVLDAASTEDQIEAEVEKQGERVSSVDCPSDVEIEPKTTFTCAVHLANGDTETATLLIRDEDANLNFVKLQPDESDRESNK